MLLFSGLKLCSRNMHVNSRLISHHCSDIHIYKLFLCPMERTKTGKRNIFSAQEWQHIIVCVIAGESYAYSKEEESTLRAHCNFLFFPLFFLYNTRHKKHVFNFRTSLCWNELGQHHFYSQLNSMFVFRSETCIYFDIDTARNVFKAQLKKRSLLCMTL